MNWIQSLLRTFGFGKRLPQMTVEENEAFCDGIDARLNAVGLKIAKTRRLAEIAHERAKLIADLKKAVAQKGERVSIRNRLKALTNEELQIECGK